MKDNRKGKEKIVDSQYDISPTKESETQSLGIPRIPKIKNFNSISPAKYIENMLEYWRKQENETSLSLAKKPGRTIETAINISDDESNSSGKRPDLNQNVSSIPGPSSYTPISPGESRKTPLSNIENNKFNKQKKRSAEDISPSEEKQKSSSSIKSEQSSNAKISNKKFKYQTEITSHTSNAEDREDMPKQDKPQKIGSPDIDKQLQSLHNQEDLFSPHHAPSNENIFNPEYNNFPLHQNPELYYSPLLPTTPFFDLPLPSSPFFSDFQMESPAPLNLANNSIPQPDPTSPTPDNEIFENLTPLSNGAPTFKETGNLPAQHLPTTNDNPPHKVSHHRHDKQKSRKAPVETNKTQEETIGIAILRAELKKKEQEIKDIKAGISAAKNISPSSPEDKKDPEEKYKNKIKKTLKDYQHASELIKDCPPLLYQNYLLFSKILDEDKKIFLSKIKKDSNQYQEKIKEQKENNSSKSR